MATAAPMATATVAEVGQPDFAAIAQTARLLAVASSALIAVLIAAHFALTPRVRNCPVYGFRPSVRRLLQAS